jgi:diadenosine tetraphosphate (Ap4A) HIT family hydrolase
MARGEGFVDAPHDLGRGHHVVHPPAVGAADVHELDEAQDVAAAAEMAGHGDDLVVVEAALDDHVDLERREAGGLGGGDAGQHVGDRHVHVVHGAEGGVVEGVEADGDPASPAALRAAAFWAAARRWW